MQALLDELAGALGAAIGDAGKDDPALAALRRRGVELSARLGTMLANDEHAGASVRWAQSASSGISLHYAPLDVAEQLGGIVDAHPGAWICTSATLAVGNSFEHYLRRIGVKDATTAQFGSPFDYARQALLYLPTELEPPSSPRYIERVVDVALDVLEGSGGRAFLLFTSHRALREAADILAQRLGGQPAYPMLVQGDAPREALLARFRDYGNAVLLGTSSFWEGVDVKGAALSVVVIDKLPFAAPDDPVLKARLAAIERRGGNPFFEEQIPQAAIALKQGVGRLIRDPCDFGVIVLCDPRLRTRAYGRIFLDSLPAMPRTSDPGEVRRFLRAKLSAAGIVPGTSEPRTLEAADAGGTEDAGEAQDSGARGGRAQR